MDGCLWMILELFDSLQARKVHCCGPVRYIIEEECCRILAEGNSN
jgi:hypothetical protein